MTTTPPEAPPGPPPAAAPAPGPDDGGPRVSREEMRDLSRLRRSSRDSKIAGVAGGIARHVDVDPLVIRVAFVVLALFGAGILLYAVCWLIVPRDDGAPARIRLDDRSRSIALVITGGVAVLAVLGRSVWGFPWPLAVTGVVVLAIMLVRGESRGVGDRTGPWPPPAYASPVSSATPPPTDTATYAPTYAPTYVATAPPVPRRRGPLLVWYALALIVIGDSVLGMADAAGAGITDSAYPALALGVSGVTLAVGAFWGRAGGVILLGLVATVATLLTTVTHDVDAGQIAETPRTAADVDGRYHLGAGEVELDLTQVADVQDLDGRQIHLDVGFGRVYVIVPAGIDVNVDASVSVGNRSVFGDESHQSGSSTYDGGINAPTLAIDAHVGVGQVEIRTAGATR